MAEQVRGVGRPPVTTHEEIETVAFALFRAHGFDETTMDDIASAMGVGRSTLFRYYPSKNDILWGRFDIGLRRLEEQLSATPRDLPALAAITRAVVEFNHFEPEAISQHRERMRLLLRTPALQAHSVLRYQQWRRVIAGFAARRFGLEPDDGLPVAIGHVSLALSLAAYERWLDQPGADLSRLLAESGDLLRQYVAP
jgi:mycofactocin system transcriptional regulator